MDGRCVGVGLVVGRKREAATRPRSVKLLGSWGCAWLRAATGSRYCPKRRSSVIQVQSGGPRRVTMVPGLRASMVV